MGFPGIGSKAFKVLLDKPDLVVKIGMLILVVKIEMFRRETEGGPSLTSYLCTSPPSPPAFAGPRECGVLKR